MNNSQCRSENDSNTSIASAVEVKSNNTSTASQSPSTSKSKANSKWTNLLSGGTIFDAFIMEASQQIGQSILTLPWIFANMGFTLGVVCLILVTCASMWTQNLLITLLVEYRKEKKNTLPSKSNSSSESLSKKENAYNHEDENDHITSYHDIIAWAAGNYWGNFSRVIVILALGGLSVAQIVSTANNLYLLNWGIDKRTLSLIVGGIVSLVCFIPTYREYRVFTFLGLVATTYTAWFCTVSSVKETHAEAFESVEYDGPTTMKMFFTCLSSMIFMFGTHSAAIEKADVMNKPSRYDIAFNFAMLYVYTITLPNGLTGYYAFGNTAATQSNAFYLFDDTIWRQIGVVLMCLHEIVAFGLFSGPLFHILEKTLKIDHKGYWLRTSSRFVIVALILLVALMFPFFGVINGVIGAFTTTFGTFIIPCAVYNIYYNSREKYQGKAKNAPLKVNYNAMVIVNWIIIVLIAIFGVGFGSWATTSKLIDSAESMSNGFFAKCYNC